MKALSVDLEELGNALYDGDSPDFNSYLDLRTGEVLCVTEEMIHEFPEYKGIEKKPEIFLPIEPVSSKEGFRVMEDFVESLPEGEARRSLERALRLPKPFRTFKETLVDFADVRAAWFEFEGKRHRETAIAFLDENKVEWS